MKKLLTVLFTILLVLSLCACGKKEEPEVIENNEQEPDASATLANPMVSYDSLEEINKKAGVNIISPGVMGKDNEQFFVIGDKIAQYDFELNGNSFTIRGAYDTENDISGIYDENNVFDPNSDSTVYTNDYYLERFFDGDRQYTVVVDKPEDLDEVNFSDICFELESIMKSHNDDPVVGDYQDLSNTNNTAFVERRGDTYFIVVDVVYSNNESKSFLMEATKDGDTLNYAGESITFINVDENGGEIIADGASNNLGSFTFEDGILRWTSASEEYLEKLVFNKIVY